MLLTDLVRQVEEPKGAWLTKTLLTAFMTLICLGALALGALAAPGAAMSAGFVVTDPGTLFLLGAALVSVGIWTRRLFFRKG
jgi:hypothetical protein